MRITNRMMSNNYLSNMSRNLSNLNTINNQLSTGKLINRPSDNPYKTARSMQLTTAIDSNKQYKTNIQDATNWLDATDDALSSLTNVLQRVRELMVSSGNAAYGSDEKRAIKDEMNEKVNEIAQILNTNFDGKYIFGGSKGSTKPIGTDKNIITGNNSLHLSGNNGEVLNIDNLDEDVQNQINMINKKLAVEVSQGVTMDYNVSATDILLFKDKNGVSINVMDLLKDITNNVVSENPLDGVKITSENLKVMDETVSNLLRVRAEVGAKQNRMESAGSQNEDQNFNLTDILSQTEDIDLAQKNIEAAVAQNVYMASLQVSAKIIQPSLLDFLR